MGRYGITIKNPDFEGICFDSKQSKEEIEEQIMQQKAVICSYIINSNNNVKFSNVNTYKYTINLLFSFLEIKWLAIYKKWVENDELYLDDVKHDESIYLIEDYISDYKEYILRDKELLYIYCLSDVKDTFNSDIENLVEDVMCRINNHIKDFEEIISTYIAYKIAQKNFDKRIEEKDEYEDLRKELSNDETDKSES